MKKILATMALVGLTAAAFAQTAPAATPTTPAPAVAFSGSFDFGGLAYQTATSPSGTDWKLKSFDPVNSTNGRANFNIKYDAGNFGWYFRFREQDNWTSGNSGTDFVRRAYAWTDLAGGAVRISAGRLNTQSWATGSGGNSWEDLGGIDGLVGSTVEFKVVDNLNFGVYVPFNATADDFGTLAGNSLIAGAYKFPGVGDVQAGFEVGADNSASSPLNTGLVYAGAAYTGTPGLTAYGQFLTAYINDGTNGFSYFAEYLAYDLTAAAGVPLNASLLASQQVFANSNYGTALYFNPSVDYLVDIYDPGISAVVLYDTGTIPTGNNVLQNYGYEIDPFIKVKVAKNVSVTWFVGVTSGTGTLSGGDSYIGGTAPGFRDTKTGKTFQGSGSKYTNAASATTSSSTALYWQQAAAAFSSSNPNLIWGALTDVTFKSGLSISVNY